jgi:hypothetical protein
MTTEKLFKAAEPEVAFLKMGIYGSQGSGKTRTASNVAIGLYKHIQAKKPVYFLDSETGSDYVRPLFEKEKIPFFNAKSRAFSDLLEALKEAEKEASIFIVDSITHFWDELVESYKQDKNLSRLTIRHWGEIKPIWRDFSAKYVMSNLHIIVCGRAGDVWEEKEDEEGVKELMRTGTRMRVEKELGYEPSLLVEMVKERLSAREGAGWTHRAWIVKDRFDVIDSQHFDDPNFESFLPHISLLNLGGKHRALDPDRTSKELFRDSGNGYERMKQHDILLEKIQAEIYLRYPGQSVDDKTGRSNLMNDIFQTRSWKEIEGMKNIVLQDGLDQLLAMNGKEKSKEKKEKKK